MQLVFIVIIIQIKKKTTPRRCYYLIVFLFWDHTIVEWLARLPGPASHRKLCDHQLWGTSEHQSHFTDYKETMIDHLCHYTTTTHPSLAIITMMVTWSEADPERDLSHEQRQV